MLHGHHVPVALAHQLLDGHVHHVHIRGGQAREALLHLQGPLQPGLQLLASHGVGDGPQGSGDLVQAAHMPGVALPVDGVQLGGGLHGPGVQVVPQAGQLLLGEAHPPLRSLGKPAGADDEHAAAQDLVRALGVGDHLDAEEVEAAHGEAPGSVHSFMAVERL